MNKKQHNFCYVVFLIPFPFTDLSSSKLRPALIISKNNSLNEDIIVSFISTKISKESNAIFLSHKDEEFLHSGLKKDSEIRLNKLATLKKSLILGEIGNVSEKFLQKHQKKFYNIFAIK